MEGVRRGEEGGGERVESEWSENHPGLAGEEED
jgi:hypothetical protein